MNVLFTLLLLALGASSIIFMRMAQSGVAWAKPVTVACTLALMVLALVQMFAPDATADPEADRRHYEGYHAVCGEYLGQNLAARHPGARVTLLTWPTMISPPQGSRILQASLKDTLESGGLTVTIQPIVVPDKIPQRLKSAGSPEMLMNSSLGFGPRELRQTLSALSGQTDLAVCTIDLMFDLETNSLPPRGSDPAVVLINSFVSDPEFLLRRTSLDALVTIRNNPDIWKRGATIPNDLADAFNQRFELHQAGK